MTQGFDLVVAEGLLDAAVAKKLLQHLRVPGPEPQDLGGGTKFWAKVPNYNQAARSGRVILGIVDLENADCAPGLIVQRLPKGLEPTFVLRVAHRMIESWLLADRDAIAQFLRVSRDRIPSAPESLAHPKRELGNLALRSSKREIRETVAPEKGLSGPVGKEYTPMMKRFVEDHWDPSRARQNSPSLDQAMLAILRATQS